MVGHTKGATCPSYSVCSKPMRREAVTDKVRKVRRGFGRTRRRHGLDAVRTKEKSACPFVCSVTPPTKAASDPPPRRSATRVFAHSQSCHSWPSTRLQRCQAHLLSRSLSVSLEIDETQRRNVVELTGAWSEGRYSVDLNSETWGTFFVILAVSRPDRTDPDAPCACNTRPHDPSSMEREDISSNILG